MNRNEVLEKIINVFATMSEVEEITEESELLEDLELSSIDVFSLLATLETEFSITIPEKMIRKMVTVEDVADIVIDLM